MAPVVRLALGIRPRHGKGSMTALLLEWVGGGIIAPNGVGGQRISGQQREGTKRLAARNSPRASEERTDGQKDASNFASPHDDAADDRKTSSRARAPHSCHCYVRSWGLNWYNSK